MTKEITLEDKLVGEIEGEFIIPSYQRGYRWERKQVETLLNDIMDNGDKPYCLQPVVVRKRDDGKFELIDGQQRLTTIYILLNYLKREYKPRLNIKYTLTYQMRKGSGDFLNNMTEEHADDYIDYRFMYNAYLAIDGWFKQMEAEGKDQSAADLFVLYFFPKVGNSTGGNVRFIWYEVQNVEDKDAISLFTRLNIGRIPLTNAELVKALFLCRKEDNVQAEKWQQEIALQWDTIERELHDDDFWNFLTRESADNYSSRIELIFNFMVPKDQRSQDPYSTFYYFSAKTNLQEYWKDVLKYYYRLKEWYKKDRLYHKIGYLVASGHKEMSAIVDETTDMRKSELEQYLDEEIRSSIKFPKVKYSELRYDNSTGYDYISRILLLFNVISVMNRRVARFPFKKYNNTEWSLEHIHPQHPEVMPPRQELWRDWVANHLTSVSELGEADEDAATRKQSLLGEMKDFLAKEKVTMDMFKTIADKVLNALSDKSGDDLTHSLSNMALLSKDQNSALNNSLFDAKRRKIINMDRRGEYIPYCTRMVFLKYYTERADEKQMFCWSSADRKAYVAAMNRELKTYLAEEIQP
ncbi:MAG: DUF262 domain-containing protein [Muribaculaceae bacterium]|nr:DUF262 domain-containing protein [Muribaculaceae bacterium]